MKLFAGLVLLVACEGSPKKEQQTTSDTSTSRPVAVDRDIETLRTKLAIAEDQSLEYLWGGAVPVGKDVRELIEKDTQRAWWEKLTPKERFFLFEISRTIASKAPADVRAEAFCAGVQNVNAEWFSIPGDPDAEATKAALGSKTPVAACLVKLFDEPAGLHYSDGESNLNAEEHKWTVGDLAAGIVALSLGEDYDNRATPEARAARRAELRAKIH